MWEGGPWVPLEISRSLEGPLELMYSAKGFLNMLVKSEEMSPMHLLDTLFCRAALISLISPAAHRYKTEESHDTKQYSFSLVRPPGGSWHCIF